jgi:hypothetical protein
MVSKGLKVTAASYSGRLFWTLNYLPLLYYIPQNKNPFDVTDCKENTFSAYVLSLKKKVAV